jgi:penicillin-binding protein 1C
LIDVDQETGLALTPQCRAGRRYVTEQFLVLPVEARRYLARADLAMSRVPEYASGCQPEVGQRPQIVEPSAGQISILIPGIPAERQDLILLAKASGAGGRLSWFVDGQFIATALATDPVRWTPVVGTHEIVVTDEAGRSSTRTIEVRSRD